MGYPEPLTKARCRKYFEKMLFFTTQGGLPPPTVEKTPHKQFSTNSRVWEDRLGCLHSKQALQVPQNSQNLLEYCILQIYFFFNKNVYNVFN